MTRIAGQQSDIESAQEEWLAHRLEACLAQADETDVLSQHLNVLLGESFDHVALSAVGIRCDLQREALRGEGHIFPAVGIEVGEKDRIDTVRPFGARDERIFELPVAGGSRSRRLDGFGGFDVVLLERGGQRQFRSLMKGRLPCPVIFTVKVPAELAAVGLRRATRPWRICRRRP